MKILSGKWVKIAATVGGLLVFVFVLLPMAITFVKGQAGGVKAYFYG